MLPLLGAFRGDLRTIELLLIPPACSQPLSNPER